MKLAGANNDLAKNVVLLGHRHDASGLAEDVLDNFSAGFDPLTVFDHQQGDVLVDLVGFLGNPQQGAALVHFVAVFGTPGFLDGQARGELDGATGRGTETVIVEFGDDLAITNLAARNGVEAVANVVLALEVPQLTGVGGFALELAVLQGEAGGHDLNFAGITSGFAQANGTAVLTHQTALRQHFAGGDRLGALNHGQGIGGQVVNIAAEHPHPPQTLGLQGDVALAVSGFLGLDGVFVTDLTSQITDHVLGGLLNALLDGHAGGNLGEDRVRKGCVTVGDEQNRTAGDIDFLGLALAGRLEGQAEIRFSHLGLHTVGGPESAHPGLGPELHNPFQQGAHHAGFCGRHTTGVEGPHGELGTRLTNGLGGHDAHGFAEVNELVMGQGPAVALAAHRAGSLAGER